MIRFWSETGGGAGGGEVRSQPRLGDGRLNSFLSMGWRASGPSAQAWREGLNRDAFPN